jgi:hypothetical protein
LLEKTWVRIYQAADAADGAAADLGLRLVHIDANRA